MFPQSIQSVRCGVSFTCGFLGRLVCRCHDDYLMGHERNYSICRPGRWP